LRVVFVSHSGSLGGAEKNLLELVENLTKKSVTCIVLLPSDGELASELRARGIQCRILGYQWWVHVGGAWNSLREFAYLQIRTLRNLVVLWQVVRLLLEWRPDVVFTNTITVPAGAIAARIVRKPHVWLIEEFGDENDRLVFDLGIRVSTKLMDKYSRSVLTVSEAVLRRYANYIARDKLFCTYPGISCQPKESGVSKERTGSTVRLAIVGIVEERKGQSDAVCALASLRKQGVEAELDIVGDAVPNYMRKLQTTIMKEGLAPFVHFHGYLKKPSDVVIQSDIVLVCSRAEAYGRVTVEAMCLRKPIVGTNSGGTPELIEDGITGYLYTPGDCEDLAGKIRYLAENQELMRRMGENGFKRAKKKFGPQANTDEVLLHLQYAARMDGKGAGPTLNRFHDGIRGREGARRAD